MVPSTPNTCAFLTKRTRSTDAPPVDEGGARLTVLCGEERCQQVLGDAASDERSLTAGASVTNRRAPPATQGGPGGRWLPSPFFCWGSLAPFRGRPCSSGCKPTEVEARAGRSVSTQIRVPRQPTPLSSGFSMVSLLRLLRQAVQFWLQALLGRFSGHRPWGSRAPLPFDGVLGSPLSFVPWNLGWSSGELLNRRPTMRSVML